MFSLLKEHIKTLKTSEGFISKVAEDFLGLDSSFCEYIFFKCKLKQKKVPEEIPFLSTGGKETCLEDLAKQCEGAI